MMKLTLAAITFIGIRILAVRTRGEPATGWEQPSPPVPSLPASRQVVICRWQTTAGGRLEARWVPNPAA
jgi:hypothetical protein